MKKINNSQSRMIQGGIDHTVLVDCLFSAQQQGNGQGNRCHDW